jgi:hypothetical protein
MSKPLSRPLRQVQSDFGTEDRCLAYLEAMRWPGGVRCLKCDSAEISVVGQFAVFPLTD